MMKICVLAAIAFLSCATVSQAQTAPDADPQARALTCMGVYLNVMVRAADSGGDVNANTGLNAATDVYQQMTQKTEDEMADVASDKAVEIQDAVAAGRQSLADLRASCDAEFMADKPMI